jgi:hypothetical protein
MRHDPMRRPAVARDYQLAWFAKQPGSPTPEWERERRNEGWHASHRQVRLGGVFGLFANPRGHGRLC